MIRDTSNKITVFGMGYVGCVSAACLARDGHEVIGLDVNPDKVDTITAGRSPVKEKGLEELINQLVANGTLTASLDAKAAVVGSDVSMICVGTPSSSNGSLKLQYVENVCREIGTALVDHDGYHTVVVRSTVVPGTVRNRLMTLLEETSGRKAGRDFGLCMNPEFLREGSALEDYYHPGHIVIGQLDETSGNVVAKLYQAVGAPLVQTSIETAEMVKYVNNAFHALKVVFANEIGNLCKAHHIDGRQVMDIFCQDRRLNISEAYLKPGFAFGGSCLPKDLRALMYDAKSRDIDCPVLGEVLRSNERHIQRGIAMIERTGRQRIGIFGLSFKAHTDDVRESPVVPMIETLVGRGFTVSVYDEHVDPQKLIGSNRAFLERELPHIATLMRKSIDNVIEESEVLVVTSGSRAFREVPDKAGEHQIVIDLVGTGKSSGAERNGNYQGICW